MTFTFQGTSDAHLGFFSSTSSTSEVYEIVLGGWGNTRSAIRKCTGCENQADDYSQNLLSVSEARPFWADAVGGLVQVGTGSTVGANVLMQWQDPDHHVATHIGVMAGTAPASGMFCDTGGDLLSPLHLLVLVLPPTGMAGNIGSAPFFSLPPSRASSSSSTNR